MNIVKYTSLAAANFTVQPAPITLFNLIEATNPGFKEKVSNNNIQLNSMRIYVHSGIVGFRFDGNLVSTTAFIGMEEAQHLLENCDLSKVSLIGIDGEANLTIQIGQIY